jgi:hypothetical protein
VWALCPFCTSRYFFFLDGGWPLFKFQKKILGYLSAASRQTFFTSLAVWLGWFLP